MHKGIFQVICALVCGVAVNAGAQSITFSPKYGKVGSPIFVNGTGFTLGMTVKVTFFDNKSVYTAATSATQVQVQVPAGAITGPISVTANGVTRTSTDYFVVLGPGPYVTNFSPTFGGGIVQIDGMQFSSPASVQFAGKLGTLDPTSSVTQNRIRVYPPAAAVLETGPITVTCGGYSWTSVAYYYGLLRNVKFTPTNGPAGTVVTVTGTNLLDATLTLNGQAISYVADSTTPNTKLTFTIPDNATSGNVKIVTPADQATPGFFGVSPLLSSFSPNKGDVGTEVTFTGATMSSVTSVKFGSANAVTVTNATSSSIKVKVPSGATTGPITLNCPYGNVTTPTSFYMPPRIDVFAPKFGAAGTRVTISGANLIEASSVKFNGLSATISGTPGMSSLVALVPDNATKGPISVTTPWGTVTSAEAYWPPPVISSVVPDAGVPGMPIRILGIGLDVYTNVYFNGVQATKLKLDSSTQITAVVPTNATTGYITVNDVFSGGLTIGTNSPTQFRVDALKLLINKLAANAVGISWPTSAVGFQLQYATALADTNTAWSPNLVTPQVVGTANRLNLTNASAPRYYRLVLPYP